MHKLTAIPEDKIEQVLADVALDGSRVVSRYQEPDGTWTVIVSAAPEPQRDLDSDSSLDNEVEAEENPLQSAEGSDFTQIQDAPVSAEVIDRASSGALVLTEADLIALWRRSAFPISANSTVVFAIRGCLPVDYGGTNAASSHEIALSPVNYRTMNCTIGLWRPGSGFSLYPGSTVPYGPWVARGAASGGSGVNQLGRGRYRKYVPGWHKRSEGKNGHWALLQECPITIQRTGDDEDYDLADRWEVGRIAGDNIHCAFHMGPGAAIPNSKYSSLGCQVVAGTVKKGVAGSESGPWKKFISHFNGQSNSPASVEYVLFDGLEVQQMIQNQCRDKTIILRMGSQGELVAALKQRLSAKLGRALTNVPEFDAETFQAVIDYQVATFGENSDDGIVGPSTAEKLGIGLPLFSYKDAASGGSGIDRSVPTEERVTGNRSLDTQEITVAHFEKFMPPPNNGKANDIYYSYVNAFVSPRGNQILSEYGVSDNRNRLAHFFGQAAHETGGFRLRRESLYYTTVGAVRSAWQSRSSAHGDQWIKDHLLRNENAIGDWAYGDRMGNDRPGDGYTYRGGGVFQLTGKAAYRHASKLLVGLDDFDLVKNPDLIEDPFISLIAACAEWKELGCNHLADRDEARRISRGINRGDVNSPHAANGESERLELTEMLKAILAQ